MPLRSWPPRGVDGAFESADGLTVQVEDGLVVAMVTGAAPNAPVALNVTNITATSMQFNWQPGGGGAPTAYRFDLSTDPTFATYVLQDLDVGNVLLYNATGLTTGTRYYGRVSAYNAIGSSPESGVVDEVPTAGVPSAPVLSPAENNTTGYSFDIVWGAVGGASGYKLWMSTVSDFSTTVAGYNGRTLADGTRTRFTTRNRAPAVTVYVKMRAYNANGDSVDSNVVTVAVPQVSGWVVATGGSAVNAGTYASPWSLDHARTGAGGSIVGPVTVWLRGGNYDHAKGFQFTVDGGGPSSRIVFRSYPGERAVIRKTSSLAADYDRQPIDVIGDYLTFWNVEGVNTDADRDGPYGTLRRGNGFALTGVAPKVINCWGHDYELGCTDYSTEGTSEVYGSFFYNNGAVNPGVEQYGHGIYGDNSNSGNSKVVELCTVFNNFNYGVHYYSEVSDVHNVTVRGCVGAENGKAGISFATVYYQAPFLISQGAGGFVVRGGVVEECHGHVQETVSTGNEEGLGARLASYSSSKDDGVTVRRNHLWGGYRGVQVRPSDNREVSYNVVAGKYFLVDQWNRAGSPVGTQLWDNNTYYRLAGAQASNYLDRGTQRTFSSWKSATGFDANSTETSTLPGSATVKVYANKYDPNWALVVVWNWPAGSTVAVNLATAVLLPEFSSPAGNQVFLEPGDIYSVYSAFDPLGAAVTGFSGVTYAGGTVNLPMTGLSVATPVGQGQAVHPGSEFAAFLVVRTS